MTDYTRPLPRVTADNRPFWEAARRHVLALQRCDDCGHFRYPPAPVCPECLSEHATWTPASGRGVVTTFVIVHKPYFASFAADLPYNVVQVQLDEGPRLTANLVGVANADLRIGAAVEVVFDDVTPDVTLPRFRPLVKPSPR
jgi:uncharacterized OB-fold protein